MHPATTYLEGSIRGRAGAVATRFVGRIYFVVLLDDLRIAHGVLQFWRVAGDCDVARYRLGESGGTREALASAHASGVGDGRRRPRVGAHRHVMDLRKSASERRYFVTSERARKRFLPCLDGAHAGFDAASVRVASAALGFGCRRISFWAGDCLVAEAQTGKRSRGNLPGNHHGDFLLCSEYCTGGFWA